MNLARRTLIILFSLLLLFDLLFWLLAIASGHNIPTATIRFILITAVILILLIVLTYKYLRPNRNNTFEK